MNYYIQGDAAKADQIKAAFEAKGFNTLGINFENKTLLYFSFEGCIKHCSDDWFFTHLIKTHPDYKELELPVEPKFKVGDWIVQNDNGTVSQITKVINDTDEYGEYHAYEHTNGYFHTCFENEYHLWSIADARDGDVLAADECYVIFKEIDGLNIKCYCTYRYMGFNPSFHIDTLQNKTAFKPAAKEQRDLLFSKMREAGYEWDADKKELKKIQPHYDIDNFKPKQWVLVRDDDEWEWALTRFSYLSNGSASLFVCINGASFQQCIPFEDNEKLLGTTDMCDEQYINW